MRDEFPDHVKVDLASRVRYRCSNPRCRQLTSGPQMEATGSINVGVAAHITAASPGGPRYNASLTPEQRKSSENGIWLCQKCGKLVDSDLSRYSVATLRKWKKSAEAEALNELEGRVTFSDFARFIKLESLMPDLLAEMRDDLTEYPIRREFVLLHKRSSYWASGEELCYFYDDHPDLRSKIRILENYNMVRDITYTNVDRFLISEEFADYLLLPKNLQQSTQ